MYLEDGLRLEVRTLGHQKIFRLRLLVSVLKKVKQETEGVVVVSGVHFNKSPMNIEVLR